MKMFPYAGLGMYTQPRVEDDAWKIRLMLSDLIYNVGLTFITCVGTRGEYKRGRARETGRRWYILAREEEQEDETIRETG